MTRIAKISLARSYEPANICREHLAQEVGAKHGGGVALVDYSVLLRSRALRLGCRRYSLESRGQAQALLALPSLWAKRLAANLQTRLQLCMKKRPNQSLQATPGNALRLFLAPWPGMLEPERWLWIGVGIRIGIGIERDDMGLLRASPTKMLLDRIVAMLTKLGQRGHAIHEEPGEYRAGRNDTDSDIDPDADGNMKPENSQPCAPPNPSQGRDR